MIENILLDLDGTLIDSAEGILNSVAYAFEKLGEAVPPREELLRFIGPPLSVSFREFYGMSEERAAEAVTFYRENYAPRGVYEFRVYDGILSFLKKMQKSGRKLYLATSKPQVFAEKILTLGEMAAYFSGVVGSLLPSGRDSKAEVISYLLETEGLSPEHTVMVGDRHYDIEGAHAVGIAAIGVTYGYGSEKELNRAGVDLLASSPKELARMIQMV